MTIDLDKIALEVAKEVDFHWDGPLYPFVRRLVARIQAEQEPVSLYPCGFKKLHSLVIERGAYLARAMQEDEPVTEPIRERAMQLVSYAKDMAALFAKQPLFTFPPATPSADEIDRLKHERYQLALAIRNAAVKVGIVRDDVSLTGPHLLMLADDLATAAPSAVPPGWKLVPEEPTEKMKAAAWRLMNEHGSISDIYAAMLAAAPTPKESE